MLHVCCRVWGFGFRVCAEQRQATPPGAQDKHQGHQCSMAACPAGTHCTARGREQHAGRKTGGYARGGVCRARDWETCPVLSSREAEGLLRRSSASMSRLFRSSTPLFWATGFTTSCSASVTRVSRIGESARAHARMHTGRMHRRAGQARAGTRDLGAAEPLVLACLACSSVRKSVALRSTCTAARRTTQSVSSRVQAGKQPSRRAGDAHEPSSHARLPAPSHAVCSSPFARPARAHARASGDAQGRGVRRKQCAAAQGEPSGGCDHGAAADAIDLSPFLRVHDSERRHCAACF